MTSSIPRSSSALTDAAGNVIGTAISGENGLFSFCELTEGTYTLTETKVPDGYMDQQLSVTVTITQNSVTMEYSVTFEGAYSNAYTGVGSISDPLCIKKTNNSYAS